MVLFHFNIDHFMNSLNQFRSVGNCLDMSKIYFNFEKEKNYFFWNFKYRVGILLYSYFFFRIEKRKERAVEDSKTTFCLSFYILCTNNLNQNKLMKYEVLLYDSPYPVLYEDPWSENWFNHNLHQFDW